MPIARAILVLALLAVAAAVVAPPARAQEGQDAAVVSLLAELQGAWARGDADGVAALFAPDGVVVFDPANPASLHGPQVYHRAAGPAVLRLGVQTLIGAQTLTGGAVRLDVAGREVVGLPSPGAQDAPATLVRWRYRTEGSGTPAPLGGLPPETGLDELVIRAGRIVSYTRIPDSASVAARQQALLALARAQPAPPRGGTPGAGAWVLAVGLCLVGLLLAAFARPRAS